ncbi:MAG: hypothetical protein KGJ80_05205 [Chloroflexota bacterium]|nr:hypothetical protein [Chloroflexota bacterium]
MEIEEYFAQIKSVVDNYAAASFVTSANVTFETRPGDQGFLSGTLQFVDGSAMHFREYLDVAGEIVEKVMCSYHCQDARGVMIFRYDNAAHKPTLATLGHRHDSAGVKPTETPSLEQVLAELVEMQHWI